ncbi:hypothetical protein PCE1_001091 [Barthelona sp. PCE]
MVVTSEELVNVIKKHKNKLTSPQILSALRGFIDANLNIQESHNYRRAASDDVITLFEYVSRCEDDGLLLALTAVKIFSRKEVNRVLFQSSSVTVLFAMLDYTKDLLVWTEIVAIILNLCYDMKFVAAFLEMDGISTLKRIVQMEFPFDEYENADDDSVLLLKSYISGTFQSICYTQRGKAATIDAGMLPIIVSLLKTSQSQELSVRCMGVLHNVSSDLRSLDMLVSSGIVDLLPRLLSSYERLAGPTAGLTQNLSRKEEIREHLRGIDAVELCTELLGRSTEANTQLCCVGALINLLGPEYDSTIEWHLIKQSLVDTIVAATISSAFSNV